MDAITSPSPASSPSQQRVRTSVHHERSAGTVLALAVVVGAGWGAVTSGLQTVLPAPWSALANSVTPWVLPSFLVGAAARRWQVALLAGVVVCLGEVAGYYLLSTVRGFGVGAGEVVLWSATAVVGGPLFGVAGWLWRRGPLTRWRWPALGAALVAAAFLAEAAAYQHYLDYTGQAVLFAVLGVVVLLLGAGASGPLGGRSVRWGVSAAAAWLLVALPAGLLGEVVLHSVLG